MIMLHGSASTIQASTVHSVPLHERLPETTGIPMTIDAIEEAVDRGRANNSF